MSPSRRICMISISDVVFDGRTQRSAETMAKDGFEVEVLGFTREPGLPERLEKANPRYRLFGLRDQEASWLAKARQATFMAWLVAMTCRRRVAYYHLHEPLFLPLVVSLGRLRRAKVVYDVRELFQGRFAQRSLASSIERRWQARCRGFAIPSEERRDFFEEKFPLAGRPMVVVRNLPRRADSPRKLRDEVPRGAELYCVYHGRISSANRHLEELVLAFGNLPAHLSVMGADSQGTRARLRRLVETEGLGNVSFHDPCPPEHLISICDGFDLGMMPYRMLDANTQLANPTKLAEYAGAGLALIGSRFPLLEEVLAEHRAGQIWDFSLPATIAGSLTRLIESRQAVEEMKQGSRIWYDAHCDWEKESRGYVRLYEELD